MSRLIIKNLPAYVTPVRLREHLERQDGPGGAITDVKVPLKRDGTSRRFAFVGYKTETEATAAQAWFNKTFIDAARIAVEIIQVIFFSPAGSVRTIDFTLFNKGTKDAPAPRPNKRPRLDLSSNDPSVKQPTKTKTSKRSERPSDPQFEQFLQVMKPRKKDGPAWANDAEPIPMATPLDRDESDEADTSGDESLADENDANKTDEGISDLDWMRRHMSKKADAELSPEQILVEESSGKDDEVRVPFICTSR
jgi:multiple RNA-binding domain-containing protein 1